MIPTLLLAAALAQAGAPPAPQKAAAPAARPAPSPAEQAALVEGRIPDDPARALLQAKCLICHTADYVTQQRLTEGQWQKTIEKMKKWGSPIADDEVKALAAWLGRTWTPDLPERRSPQRPAPAGSLPAR